MLQLTSGATFESNPPNARTLPCSAIVPLWLALLDFSLHLLFEFVMHFTWIASAHFHLSLPLTSTGSVAIGTYSEHETYFALIRDPNPESGPKLIK